MSDKQWRVVKVRSFVTLTVEVKCETDEEARATAGALLTDISNEHDGYVDLLCWDGVGLGVHNTEIPHNVSVMDWSFTDPKPSLQVQRDEPKNDEN